jgi:single-stranded-DNA-specific exonuclease
MMGYKRQIHRRDLSADGVAGLQSLHPVLARVYAARSVVSDSELASDLERLLPLQSLKGIEASARLLADGIEAGRRFLVVGDFDADGATSSALTVRAMRALGADIDFLVPNRFEFGYGLTPEIVEVAVNLSPDILITVDNGIASLAGVAAARAHGLQVVITDHHLPGKELPAADAIVNPNQPDDHFASKNLAGVGVIFYVMLALRAELRDRKWFERRGIEEPNMARYLDLVALGTVADVVPLDQNNRILVEQGIRRIRSGQCCPAITCLLRIAGRNQASLVASDLGFAVGPRLNAAGRLDDMSLGIECLLSDDESVACELAQRLDSLNHERRSIEQDMREQALAEVGKLHLESGGDTPAGVCLYQPDWHQGVIGIVASRIKEQLHRPVIAFADAGNGEMKGSARSIPGLHIRDVLDAIATANPGLISRFGGHAMAAGLTLPLSAYDRFRQAFDSCVRSLVSDDMLQGVVLSDGELGTDELGLKLAEQLRLGGPWGQGFPEPVFDGEFEIVQRRLVGERHLKMIVRQPGQQTEVDAIAFNALDRGWDRLGDRVVLAYRLDVNEFRGRRTAQLVIEHMDAASAP